MQLIISYELMPSFTLRRSHFQLYSPNFSTVSRIEGISQWVLKVQVWIAIVPAVCILETSENCLLYRLNFYVWLRFIVLMRKKLQSQTVKSMHQLLALEFCGLHFRQDLSLLNRFQLYEMSWLMTNAYHATDGDWLIIPDCNHGLSHCRT
jgi:hypothetical protein